MDLNISELETVLGQVKGEIEALKAGRKASAPRARKSLQSLKKISHDMRKDITSYSKNLPVKSRSKTIAEPVAEPVPEPAVIISPEKSLQVEVAVKKTRKPRKKNLA